MSIGLVRPMGVTLAILLVSSCGEPPARALFTVNYYRTHDSDRVAKVQECQSKPDEAKTPDCMNATQAQAAKDAEDAAEAAKAAAADSSAQPAEPAPQPAPAQPAKN